MMDKQQSLLDAASGGDGASGADDGQPRVRKLYWQRWWLVAVFSVLGICQSASWNFYSPISGPIKNVYGWSDYLIGWMANTAGIVFFLSVSAWSAVIDTKGSRFTTLASVSMMLY